MKHLFMHTLCMFAVVATVGQSAARADQVDFSYQWSANPSNIGAGGAASGSVSITPEPAGSGQYTIGGTAALIQSVSFSSTTSALASAPDVYTGTGADKFQITLSLEDSGNKGTLTFSGAISGALGLSTTGGANLDTLTATFSSPLSQTLTLGSHTYTVSIDPLVNVPDPTSTAGAFLTASVTAIDSNGPPVITPPPTTNTPEPSSLVLGGVALAGFAARRWTRKKGAA